MKQMPGVLVVSDEAPVLRLIALHLEANDTQVRTARTGAEALVLIATDPSIDLVVMDLQLPVMDGFETLARIRAISDVPVIMITEPRHELDRIGLLVGGADDCMAKPINPDELAARVGTVLRRVGHGKSGKGARLIYGALVIDLAQRRVTRDGVEVRLSRTEWELLHTLAQRVGKVLPSRQLLTAVWGGEFSTAVQYLHTWVSRLRRKLGDDLPLTTIPGIGYQLAAPGDMREQVAITRADAVGERRPQY